MATDFESYRKREIRRKELERLLVTVRAYLGTASINSIPDKLRALADLREAVERLERMPPPVEPA